MNPVKLLSRHNRYPPTDYPLLFHVQLDRIARSATQGIELIQSLLDKGITVHVLNVVTVVTQPANAQKSRI